MQNIELRNILDAMTQSFIEIYGEKLKFVILYGSVAKGTAAPDSDIDIMLLVDSSMEELRQYEEELCNVSTNYALEYFKVFSIIDVCYSEFVEMKQVLPFYRNVEKEGVILYAA